MSLSEPLAPPDSNSPSLPEDARLAVVLDQYLEYLQQGQNASCRQLLEEHPDLEELAGCLDALNSLWHVPPSDATPRGHAPTIMLSDGQDSSAIEGLPEAGDSSANFGKYELLEEIGRGGMGVIFKARQHGLDRHVALKLILSNHLASADEIRRFYLEAKAAGGLKHPNIVAIHEVGEVRGQHYFAMDYIEGRSLADLLRSGPLPPETTVECLLSIIHAVQHLHDHGVVHRDLKPSNILIDEYGTPYVTDFGLAKVRHATDNRTQTGTIIGTPAYMAPEQAAGKTSEVSATSDVYSLGAILYEMLTGQPPFLTSNPLDTLVQVLETEPLKPSQLRPDLPRSLELICLKCLEKDPDRRYASAADLAADLRRFLAGDPVEAHGTGPIVLFRRWIRREPAFASQILSVCLAALIVQLKYMHSGIYLKLHLEIMSVFGVWAVAHFAFKYLIRVPALSERARYGWLATDVALLTLILYLAGRPDNAEPLGPLLISYPTIVVASGLFSQVRLVWFTTVISIAGYSMLPLTLARERIAPHYPIILIVLLALVGLITAYQVHRLRVLGRYYESRREDTLT